MDARLESLPDATLVVECEACNRTGRYTTRSLILRFGADATLSEVLPLLCDRAEETGSVHRPRLVGVLRLT